MESSSRASAPQGMGRGVCPVGALPPYLPRGFFTLTHKVGTHKREEERVQGTGNHTTKENNFPN